MELPNLTKIARICFLCFVIVISVYFMLLNKGYLASKKETFVDAEAENKSDLYPTDKASREKLLKTQLQDAMKKEPSPEIVSFYMDYIAKNPSITQDAMEMIIGGSIEAVSKSQTNGEKLSEVEKSGDVYGTEDDVTKIFNEVLFRNPDPRELEYFARKLKSDKSFTQETLQQLLYTSEEYKRLERTQSNKVYSNLMGGVSDRQLTLMINTSYKNVTGQEYVDPELMVFLKKKYVEFHLSQSKFEDFLKKYIKNDPFGATSSQSSQPAQRSQNTQSQSTQQIPSNVVTKDDMEKFKQEMLKEVLAGIQNLPKDTKQTVIGADGKEKSPIDAEAPNRQVIEILLRTAQESSKTNYLDSQNILDKIKEEASCVFDKNNPKSASSLADIIDQRNTEELKNTCVRNKKYLGIDEDMVLDSSLKWSVPQPHPPICVGPQGNYQPSLSQTALIGTLLEEAKDTQVGSILPKIPPR